MNNDSTQNENREFSRVETHPRARLALASGEELLTGFLMDVSLGGFFIEGECAQDTSEEIVIAIMLGDNPEENLIDALGKIVRQDARGVAVEFTELENTESLEHLRNLILYNSKTPESVEEEIRDHKGIARRSGASG